VLYTSGTTGLPKGVVISHRAWLARGYNYITDFDLRRGDGQLAWPPLFHIVSADWLPAVATLGGTFYPVDGFDTERVVEILRQEGCAIGWLVLLPGVVDRLLEYIDDHDVDVSELREIRNIGALVDLIDPKKVARVTETFDMPFKNSYGSTEDGNVLSAGNDVPIGVRPETEDLAKVESSFVDLKLVDEEWNEVEGRGELTARGPTLCSGYIRNREANREDFRNGWYRTGDIFIEHDDGTYSFVNRRKYLIKSGGENIYPAELEQVLVKHEQVEEATVVRVPDEKWGEVSRTVVSTYAPEEVSADELMEMLGAELAKHFMPELDRLVEVGAVEVLTDPVRVCRDAPDGRVVDRLGVVVVAVTVGVDHPLAEDGFALLLEVDPREVDVGVTVVNVHDDLLDVGPVAAAHRVQVGEFDLGDERAGPVGDDAGVAVDVLDGRGEDH
jgi:acyl-CoA synthetase (AMP-forming)/AMP-acid ligase II